MPARKKHFDLIRRGEKKPTLSGTLTFIGLRLADIPLQHALLSPPSPSSPGSGSGLVLGLGTRILTSIGLRTVYTHTSTTTSLPSVLLLPLSTLFSAPPTSFTPPSPVLPHSSPILNYVLSPFANLPPTPVLLFLMSIGSAAKQIYWHLSLSQDSFPASAAAAVSAYNTTVNSLNTFLFLCLGTTSLLSPPQAPISIPFPYVEDGVRLPLSTLVGTLLYIVGLSIETIAERQRAQFKNRKENKGLVCMQGLWRWARHVNYFGYALWRGGYCMVGSGWVGGILMALWQGWDLSQRAVAVQDEYCSQRYGEQWTRFKMEVPWKIIPGVY
ncbi:hypothetical protein F4777DRAFT_484617 [Nemania sp. FL0916]|nr:hypothetical protein F4777DRAFT_484617 [Nemania sp. FL0916]